MSKHFFAALALLASTHLFAANAPGDNPLGVDSINGTKVLSGPWMPRATATATPPPAAKAAPAAASTGGEVIEMVKRYTRDSGGRVIRVDYPDGSFRTTEYSHDNFPSKECDALSRCVEHFYDERSKEIETRYPDGTASFTEYDANTNVVLRKDRAGRTTKYVYDEVNRLTETILPDGTPATDEDNPRTHSIYDRAGQVTGSIDARGKRTNFGYDAAGRRTTVVDPLGNTTRTEYEDGRRTATVDAKGRRTAYVTDAAGRLVETVYVDGSSIKAEYDGVSRRTAKIDQTGKRTRFDYDPVGRLVGVPTAVGTSEAATTSYAFDEVGNKVSQTDAEGRVTRWSHDNAGRVLSRTLPGGQRETMQFNIVGNLIAHTDFNGSMTHFGYDSANRRTSIDYPNSPDVTIEYAQGETQPTRIVDGNGTTEFGYGPQGELTGIEFPHGESIAYTYDAAGNRTELVTAFQHLYFTYDDLSRLSTVRDNRGTTTYEYDEVGNRTSVLRPNGVTTNYGYDALNRLVVLTHKSTVDEVLFSARYTLNAAGLRTSIEERDAQGIVRSVTYTYDGLNRLVAESVIARDPGQSRTSGWTYDKVGNRTSQTLLIGGVLVSTIYAYDANDRLLTETTAGQTTTYSHDDNGNTLSRSGPDGLTEYSYDNESRLVEMRRPGARFTYGYDSQGLRISQTYHPVSGPPVSTYYLLDKSRPHAQVVEEHVQEGTGPRRLSAIYSFGDDLLTQTSGGETYYVLADGMGSARLLVNAAGGVTDTFAFDAFGNEVERTGTTSVGHLYRGEQYDPNLGFYYLRARYYDSRTGRFPTMDSFAGFDMDPASLHKYLYAGANPVSNIDPSGHMTMVEGMTALGVAAILTAVTIHAIDQYGRSTSASSNPAVWDAVAIPQFRARVGTESRAEAEAAAVALAATRKPPGHHTIPVYLCGSMDQATSEISLAEHGLIHTEIAGIYIALAGAEEYASKKVGRHRSLDVLRIAQTGAGRRAITAALDQIYYYGGWWQRGRPQIKDVFESERKEFELDFNAKTSLPWCSREGTP